MHSRMKYSLITILSFIVNVSLFCALPPPQGLHRREADNHVHEAATSLLLAQYATLESVLVKLENEHARCMQDHVSYYRRRTFAVF